MSTGGHGHHECWKEGLGMIAWHSPRDVETATAAPICLLPYLPDADSGDLDATFLKGPSTFCRPLSGRAEGRGRGGNSIGGAGRLGSLGRPLTRVLERV